VYWNRPKQFLPEERTCVSPWNCCLTRVRYGCFDSLLLSLSLPLSLYFYLTACASVSRAGQVVCGLHLHTAASEDRHGQLGLWYYSLSLFVSVMLSLSLCSICILNVCCYRGVWRRQATQEHATVALCLSSAYRVFLSSLFLALCSLV
jgi:hypothetical protein